MSATRDELEAIADAIRTMDPDGAFVELNIDDRTVRYTDQITVHETIGTYDGDEEPTRAYLVAWLCVVGGYSPAQLCLEHRYRIGSSNSVELDIRVARPNGDAYALIEVKPVEQYRSTSEQQLDGQLFTPASKENSESLKVLVLATVAIGASGEPAIVATAIPYAPGYTFLAWSAAGRPAGDSIPVHYGDPSIEPLVAGGTNDLRTDIGRQELDALRRVLHDRLWGGSRDDNQIYSWLTKLFLAKIHDEKHTNHGEPYSFQILADGFSAETINVTVARVESVFAEAYERYVGPITDRGSVDLTSGGTFPQSELLWVVETLQDISLTAAGMKSGDLLGAFFEAITRDGFKQSKGLFFTHFNIAVFMVAALDLPALAESKLSSAVHANDRLPYIIDPSCGSGTFLMAAMRLVTDHIMMRRSDLATNRDVDEQLRLRFPEDAPNTWAKDFLYGIEKRDDLAISTKVNMVLHRDGHTHVFRGDGLAPLGALAVDHTEQRFRPHPAEPDSYSKPVAESFDVVITNPPFSITLDGDIQAVVDSNFELGSRSNPENLFLERWYQLLRPGGRLGAVLPESFFSTAENIDARLFLLAHFDVKAVVSLPPHAFQPWTPTRTSLLFAQKKSPERCAEWRNGFDRARAEARQGLQEAKRELSRLSVLALAEVDSDPERMGSSGAIEPDEGVVEFLNEVGLDTQLAWTAEEVEATKLALADIDERQIALERLVGNLGGGSFLAVGVSEIGYRRTKRKESVKRNELFSAVVRAAGADSYEVVPNLNDADAGWEIIVEDRDTALRRIREAVQWD